MDDKIIEASRNADSHNFITELENGYDQILSREFKGGINLSVGQRQRLAIAKVFFRNAPVLILDEPTSSIDAEAEYKIFQKLYEFFEDKSIIIISHRFSTVRNAKRIYVLEKGQIVEEGTHEELLKLNGIYSERFKKQAEGYKYNYSLLGSDN